MQITYLLTDLIGSNGTSSMWNLLLLVHSGSQWIVCACVEIVSTTGSHRPAYKKICSCATQDPWSDGHGRSFHTDNVYTRKPGSDRVWLQSVGGVIQHGVPAVYVQLSMLRS